MMVLDKLLNIFQSTPPRRRRHLSGILHFLFTNDFNPRLREGGDNYAKTHKRWTNNFNPRLREGGDNGIYVEDSETLTGISIHASAKEATVFHRTYTAYL